MKTLKVNPEFGIELALAVPYAYWLHTQGELEKVITSKGMKPFYYFCDDVDESFTVRTIDNAAAGLNSLPNNWIHHNSLKVFGKEYNDLEDTSVANGVLDYSQWTPPPYKEYYKNDEFKFDDRPLVFVSNKFNLEHGETPYGYFDVKCLYDMFSYLTDAGYSVIYKRATNKEKDFTIDQNEINSINLGFDNILANVEGIGTISDRNLPEMMDNVYLLDDIPTNYSYNETQLKIMANCDRFISVCGGNSILSSYFEGTMLSYVHKGAELRPNYFGKNSYFRKLSNANIVPVFDVIGKINEETYNYKVNTTGKQDYSGLMEQIRINFGVSS
tara:strand:+ start:1194 stop:2180 length:987 start_codon:yes stop_codon:yes gene_type:complete